MRKRLEQTWRWFGPNDPVQLSHIAQAGATGIVTSLHHVPYGEIWSDSEIAKRKQQIESAGLSWSVVESVQVHDDIKRRGGNVHQWISNYRKSLRNIGKAGIRTVCYNFMPVLDWSRTDLAYPQPDGSTALRFEYAAYVAFDTEILKRRNAIEAYSETDLKAAEIWLSAANSDQIASLERTMLAGLPGTDEGYTLDQFRSVLESYDGISPYDLRSNLVHFVSAIADVADGYGISLTIHPDDPPFSLFGLPRIMSTIDDARYLLNNVANPSNTICFCTGSFGARADNDIPAMIRELAPHTGFVHLRNTSRQDDGSFHEANHLDGDTDMYAVMRELVLEQQRREKPIPFRPDHGHVMLDDLGKKTNPGYSAIGRLRGLAEMRGLELGILGGM